ncbi:MAG: hypothetical protein J3Q66DRAFT_374382 [Benniella sp.]|nr:MAG: hypothetical protein J3Q66DRAFT_374382 [Benniella sp.]
MVFGGIVSSPRGNLTSQQSLELANVYLENATRATDPNIALVLCHDTEVSLSQAKRTVNHSDGKSVREGIATAYIDLGKLLRSRGHHREAQASYKKAGKLGGRDHLPGRPTYLPNSNNVVPSNGNRPPHVREPTVAGPSHHPSPKQELLSNDTAAMPHNIFTHNLRPPSIVFRPPQPDTRLDDTPQLAYCLGLLQSSHEPDETLDPAAYKWLQVTKSDVDEKERLRALATDVIRAFKRDEFKDAKAVIEVVYLAPVLETDDFRYLVKEFYSGIEQSGLLDIHQLEGLARLIQDADPTHLDADDLVKILDLISSRLKDTHHQSPQHIYQLTLTVSHVLDAMADANVKDLDREKLHEPLSLYLDGLKRSNDSYLVYQAAYAYQALQYVPDNETLWQATLRRTGKVVKGVSGLVSAVKGLDLNGFVDGLKDIQQGLAGASEAIQTVKTAFDGVSSLAEGGQGFMECLKEGLSFKRKCAWYPALRGADTLIREGQLASFRTLVCEAPCRQDPAFQWGVCQRLGEMAVNSMWDADTRRGAVAFIGEMYQNDAVWGDQANVKQWILNVLMQISSSPGVETEYVRLLLEELGKNGDIKKQELFQSCISNGHGSHPLKITLPPVGSPSLLDRVQNRPDVEGNLRILRRHRSRARGSYVYIPPQAKATIQSPDDARFPLMEKVMEFLSSNQTVFLIQGDSGAGKSTFNRELESDLWQMYKRKTGVIPLHINLPAIDKPEHDMIGKQLRREEFTEQEIRELKMYRKFILICDGYDESQQTHNLYMSNRLNQAGEWNAKMVISCRSEYLGIDYRDRFQPGDRNNRSEPGLFHEALITPFSVDQIENYIDQYVILHQPLWEASAYKRALDLIPSLKDLVRNPFLMTLSLEVLPRMVDPGQNMSTTQVDRVSLYDQFVVHWLERGKKRLGEKELSPQAKSAFESLVDEGFTQNGIDFIKRLAVAIYKEQGGQPIVKYSRFKDDGSWKTEFFNREDENQLLREACPLTRSGNQHRFIHRSLLEYGLALAIFDPQEWKERRATKQVLERRGSTSSTFSFHIDGATDEVAEAPIDQGPDANSPLVWRYFLNDPSIVQFLSERSQQEPLFMQQLLDYIEHSKTDAKWRRAAANAMTILVRAGKQFNGADLRGIRIPGADLSNGMFDSAQLQDADLRHVNFRGAWLRQADLSRAQMAEVQFGELPFIEAEEEVTSCAYSPDGKSFCVGVSRIGISVYVYSTTNREVIQTFTGHARGVLSVMYSPNGDMIVSGSRDSTVRLWDVETGDTLHILIGHSGTVSSVAYSPRGNMIASAGYDKTVRIWDMDTEECRYTLSGHEGVVASVAFSPDCNFIASGSHDKTIRLWDATTGVCSHVMKRPQSGLVYSIAFSPRGDMISAANRSDIVLWDLKTGNSRLHLTGHSHSVKSVAYSPRGDLIASAGADGTIRVWDIEAGVCCHIMTGHSETITGVAFSPDANQLVSSSSDETVRLWDARTVASHHNSANPSNEILDIKFSPHGGQFATCSSDGTIQLWDVESGSCHNISIGHEIKTISITYSPQGDVLASPSANSTLTLWDGRTGNPLQTFTGHNDRVNAVAFSPQGDQVASASDDHTTRLWNIGTGKCLRTLTGHTDNVLRTVYSPRGHQVASGGLDSTVRIWDVDTGDCLQILVGHTEQVEGIVYSPQGHQIASASWDSTMKLWSTKTWSCQRTFTRCGILGLGAEYSPQGHQVTFATFGKEVRLYDVDTEDCHQTLRGHLDRVRSIGFSPKGSLIATGSEDKTVRLWDAASGQCRAVISDFNNNVRKVVWSPSSEVSHFVTICDAGSVRMWRVLEDEDFYRIHLCWSSRSSGLAAMDASIQDVRGLSLVNQQLLEQHGAIGEPSFGLQVATE